jgi:hypothetical protein
MICFDSLLHGSGVLVVCWWSYLCGLCSNKIYDECLSTEHSHRTNVASRNDVE